MEVCGSVPVSAGHSSWRIRGDSRSLFPPCLIRYHFLPHSLSLSQFKIVKQRKWNSIFFIPGLLKIILEILMIMIVLKWLRWTVNANGVIFQFYLSPNSSDRMAQLGLWPHHFLFQVQKMGILWLRTKQLTGSTGDRQLETELDCIIKCSTARVTWIVMNCVNN